MKVGDGLPAPNTVKQIESGDWVYKALGENDRGCSGLVLSIVHGGPGNILVEVLVDGRSTMWPQQHLLIVDKVNGEEK